MPRRLRKFPVILLAVLPLAALVPAWAGRTREAIGVLMLSLSVPAAIIGYMTIVDWLRQGDRVGYGKHCRVCDYDLKYASQGICPECGTTISPDMTVRGERHPRPLLATIRVIFQVTVLAVGWVLLATGTIIWIVGRARVLLR